MLPLLPLCLGLSLFSQAIHAAVAPPQQKVGTPRPPDPFIVPHGGYRQGFSFKAQNYRAPNMKTRDLMSFLLHKPYPIVAEFGASLPDDPHDWHTTLYDMPKRLADDDKIAWDLKCVDPEYHNSINLGSMVTMTEYLVDFLDQWGDATEIPTFDLQMIDLEGKDMPELVIGWDGTVGPVGAGAGGEKATF